MGWFYSQPAIGFFSIAIAKRRLPIALVHCLLSTSREGTNGKRSSPLLIWHQRVGVCNNQPIWIANRGLAIAEPQQIVWVLVKAVFVLPNPHCLCSYWWETAVKISVNTNCSMQRTLKRDMGRLGLGWGLGELSSALDTGCRDLCLLWSPLRVAEIRGNTEPVKHWLPTCRRELRYPTN